MGDETCIFLYTEKVDVPQLKKLLSRHYKIVSISGAARQVSESLYDSRPDNTDLKMERSKHGTTYWRY